MTDIMMTARFDREPPVVIDAEYLDRLEALASVAMQRMPDIADRLLHEIARASVVPSEDMPPNVVNLGSAVTFRDDRTGVQRTATLVLPQQADIGLNRISVLTPIGTALIGLAEGATIEWETRNGETRRLTVIRVGSDGPPRLPPSAVRLENMVDDTLDDSFPANDPPSWSLGRNAA